MQVVEHAERAVLGYKATAYHEPALATLMAGDAFPDIYDSWVSPATFSYVMPDGEEQSADWNAAHAQGLLQQGARITVTGWRTMLAMEWFDRALSFSSR